MPVELEATGLTPDTNYLVRLRGSISSGASGPASPTEAFTTGEVLKPTVSFDPVSGITSDGASFDGKLNPNAPGSAPQDPAYDMTWYFECVPGCPNTPGSQTVPADNQDLDVSFDPKGLEAGTDYEVRLIAENAGGQTVQVQSFTTVAAAPTATTHLAGGVTQTEARISGFVDPQNRPSTYHFQWGLQPDLSDAKSLPASEDGTLDLVSEPNLVFEDLTGLQPDTVYYFRVVGKSAVGTNLGEIEQLRTYPTAPARGSGVGAYGDRGLEMVSEVDKNGNPVNYTINYTADGERALYNITGGTPTTTVGDRFFSAILAERTAKGWVNRSPLPARAEIPYPRMVLRGASDDLSNFLVEGGPEVSSGGTVPGYTQLYRFRPHTNTLEPLTRWFAGAGNESVDVYDGNDDYQHLIGWGVIERPDTTNEIGRLYDFGDGEPEMISILPGDVVPGCEVPWQSQYFPLFADGLTHPLSTDGSRVFFRSQGDGDCSDTPQLYMREASPDGKLGMGTGATTTLISGPADSGEPGPTQFIKATPDGSTIYYTTTTRVSAADGNEGIDLYRYRVGAGNTCLTCVVADAQLSGFQDAVVSDDGERVYFSSRMALTPGVGPLEEEDENLYRLEVESGDLEFISPISRIRDIRDPRIQISRDGRTVLFATTVRTQQEDVANVTAAGTTQILRFAERTNSLDCVSCPRTGQALDSPLMSSLVSDDPAGPRGEALTSDGRIAVFTSLTALVPEDVNNEIDVYEWRDGTVGLVSNGKVGYPKTKVGGVTNDGRDIFFVSDDQLPSSDGTGQVYDARIGGGFAEIPPPVPCAGDSCQGPPTVAPPATAAGTAGFVGPGNRTSKPPFRCKKPKVKRNGRCVTKPSKSKSGKRTANKNRGASK